MVLIVQLDESVLFSSCNKVTTHINKLSLVVTRFYAASVFAVVATVTG